MLALLAGVVLVGVTGWMQTLDVFWGAAWLEAAHAVLAWSLLGLILVHVLAALIESLHYRENLIASMVHGRKRALEGAGDADAPEPAATIGAPVVARVQARRREPCDEMAVRPGRRGRAAEADAPTARPDNSGGSRCVTRR